MVYGRVSNGSVGRKILWKKGAGRMLCRSKETTFEIQSGRAKGKCERGRSTFVVCRVSEKIGVSIEMSLKEALSCAAPKQKCPA